MNRAKHTYFVVSGNINGNEDEASISRTAGAADTAIIGRAIGALGEMGYADADGKFRKVEAVAFIRNRNGNNVCVSTTSAAELASVKSSLIAGEHVECITLRRFSSTSTFAEWKVSKTRA